MKEILSKRAKKHHLFYYGFILAVILLSSEAVKRFIAGIYCIPTRSMEPALLPGDRVLAYKWPYRSKTSLDHHPTVMRDNIYLFKSSGRKENLVKRCAGLPGDTILIIGNRIMLNHVEISAGETAGAYPFFSDHILNNPADSLIRIPAGHCFFLGDNRQNSFDSRYWGFVPEENITGKAVLVLFNFHEGHFRHDRWTKKIR